VRRNAADGTCGDASAAALAAAASAASAASSVSSVASLIAPVAASSLLRAATSLLAPVTGGLLAFPAAKAPANATALSQPDIRGAPRSWTWPVGAFGLLWLLWLFVAATAVVLIVVLVCIRRLLRSDRRTTQGSASCKWRASAGPMEDTGLLQCRPCE